MIDAAVKLEELFPAAKELFTAIQRNGSLRRRLPLAAWTLAGAALFLIGYRLVRWADRNL